MAEQHGLDASADEAELCRVLRRGWMVMFHEEEDFGSVDGYYS